MQFSAKVVSSAARVAGLASAFTFTSKFTEPSPSLISTSSEHDTNAPAIRLIVNIVFAIFFIYLSN